MKHNAILMTQYNYTFTENLYHNKIYFSLIYSNLFVLWDITLETKQTIKYIHLSETEMVKYLNLIHTCNYAPFVFVCVNAFISYKNVPRSFNESKGRTVVIE